MRQVTVRWRYPNTAESDWRDGVCTENANKQDIPLGRGALQHLKRLPSETPSVYTTGDQPKVVKQRFRRNRALEARSPARTAARRTFPKSVQGLRSARRLVQDLDGAPRSEGG